MSLFRSYIHHNLTHVITDYLIQYIIQTFIKVLKVKEDHSSSCVHAKFDLIDVSTNLNGN